MEFEYKDPARGRGKFVVVVGLLLAVVAGIAAFIVINQAQMMATQSGAHTVSIVVARVQIPARKPIEAADVELRSVPVDDTNAAGVFADPAKVIGLVPTVTVLIGQPIYANFLGSQSAGGQFSILDPGETVAPDSQAWRAVSMTVPDDRAVGGLLRADDVVDVFLTVQITIPEALASAGQYTSDKSTKITYQNIRILQRVTSSYVLKVPLAQAEEISHLQATGTASFSFGLRPVEDSRTVDVTSLGETTNRIIARYGLPLAQPYPPGNGPLPSAPPLTSPSTPPSTPSASPSSSPGASKGP
jgi:Flp pilus assembly protein CpaB